MKMAGPTILLITLSGDSDKFKKMPTNYRLNNDIFGHGPIIFLDPKFSSKIMEI